MVNKYNIGRSIYFSESLDYNISILEKSRKSGMKYVFSTINVGEFQYDIDEIYKFIEAVKNNDMILIMDINKDSIEKFSLEILKEKGLSYIRIDDGLTDSEILELTKSFNVVLNASTLTMEQVEFFRENNVDPSTIIACHNYYPKTMTALSLERMRKINKDLKAFGFITMSFVPGSEKLRGPMYEKLPTVESHRNQDYLINILESFQCDSDIVMIGDIEITEDEYRLTENLVNGFVEIKADVDSKIKHKVFYDRVDCSDYVFRISTMRKSITLEKIDERRDFIIGDILFSNHKFLRYEGEIEIVKSPFIGDDRRDVVGRVDLEYIKYLDFVDHRLGIKLV